MTDVVTLFCPVDAKPGCGEKLKNALTALAIETRKEAGCICYRLHETANPDHFLIYEQWKNDDALTSHCNSPHLLAFLSGSAELLLEDPCGERAFEFAE